MAAARMTRDNRLVKDDMIPKTRENVMAPGANQAHSSYIPEILQFTSVIGGPGALHWCNEQRPDYCRAR